MDLAGFAQDFATIMQSAKMAGSKLSGMIATAETLVIDRPTRRFAAVIEELSERRAPKGE